jgi:DNA-binding GntR family transcriptional regulator
MAAERALPHMTESAIAELENLHQRLMDAERNGEWAVALQANFDFHFHLYRKSGLAQLLEVLEGLWVRIGPSLSALYPDAIPTYANKHQHENVIAALRAGDAYALRMAIQLDLIEGGARLVRHLRSVKEL